MFPYHWVTCVTLLYDVHKTNDKNNIVSELCIDNYSHSIDIKHCIKLDHLFTWIYMTRQNDFFFENISQQLYIWACVSLWTCWILWGTCGGSPDLRLGDSVLVSSGSLYEGRTKEVHVRKYSPQSAGLLSARDPARKGRLRSPSVTAMAQAKIQAKMTSSTKFSRTLSMADRSGLLLESLDQLETRYSDATGRAACPLKFQAGHLLGCCSPPLFSYQI